MNNFPWHHSLPWLHSIAFILPLSPIVELFFCYWSGRGWIIEHLMGQNNLIEKSATYGFLGCGFFRKECEVFFPHPPRRNARAAGPGNQRGLDLVFCLGSVSLTCGAVNSSTWEEGGRLWVSTGGRHWDPTGTYTTPLHPQLPGGKTWDRRDYEEKAGRKTSKWPAGGRRHWEWAAHQPAWRSHTQTGTIIIQHSTRSSRNWPSPRNKNQLPWFYKIKPFACLFGGYWTFPMDCELSLGPDLNKLEKIKYIGIFSPSSVKELFIPYYMQQHEEHSCG